MMEKVRIDDICRTERYYTATLLPHILFHESFAGLRALLGFLADKGIHALDAQTHAPVLLDRVGPLRRVELITEVALVRDAKFYSSWIEGLDRLELEDEEELRPDVVIIADDTLIVLEAKFFLGSMNPRKIWSQLASQRMVIEKVFLRFPGYDLHRYCHLFLSVHPSLSAETVGCQGVLSWEDIRGLAEQVLGREHYVTERLTHALEWYGRGDGRQGTRGRNYRDRAFLPEILHMCREKGNVLQVGFTNGIRALAGAAPERLKAYKFKWDLTENPTGRKERRNWIAGAQFLDLMRRKMPELFT